jgi:uncharacterized metal-binding protein YceD (DUF177 family)
MTPELPRPIAIERVGPAGLHVKVDASPAECAALARRMRLPAIFAFSCDFHLEREAAGTLLAHGRLLAEVVQTCVISLDDFTATVEERFTVRCVPAGEETDDPDPEALDEIGYQDGTLDLGEAAAEQLALALDPYPRAPDAILPEVDDAADCGPFSALSDLKWRH